MIHTAAKDAAKVVRHLREFYRLRDAAETFYPVHLNELIETVILLTRPMWKDQAQANGINIHVKRDLQEVLHILGNESGLREVLTNLIFNAVEAMASDGQITLRTGCDDNAVVLEVIDTGIGMIEEACQLCFNPFFSTKRSSLQKESLDRDSVYQWPTVSFIGTTERFLSKAHKE